MVPIQALQHIKWIFPSGSYFHRAVGTLGYNPDTLDYRVTCPDGSIFIIPKSCSIVFAPLGSPEEEPKEVAVDVGSDTDRSKHTTKV
jgi:hypothetical protein